MMGEDTNNPGDTIILSNGQHIQIVDPTNVLDQQSGSMCTLVLDPSNVSFFPVVTMDEGEEVVMYNIVDDNIKVEISDDNEEVYTEVYTQEVPKPTRSYGKSRPGPHMCKYCNKSFAQVVNLITHERIHTGEKPYKCSVCSKPFSQQPNLWKHMRIHTGERPYQCHTCKKRFTQQANLTKHMRIHTGERPYSCSFCEKCFTQQANLTKHVRLHTGERPFHCKFCSKTFVQQSNLERHERTHTGVKPFQCTVCFENFAQNAHLSKHLRTVHKNTFNSFTVPEIDQSCVKKELETTSCEESEPISDIVVEEQCKTILPKMGIPVIYCTKTGRIIRRVN